MSMETMASVRAETIEDVQAAVRAHRRLRVVGRRSKPALSADASTGAGTDTGTDADADTGAHTDTDTGGPAMATLDVSAISGVMDYSAQECTFTARAGTTIAEIEEMLARDGLYLPFEPPFRDRRATLGGTVAAGLSGPGRLRYGGVRDFLLGVRFVDGEGRVAHGGGRVVKNAAGFSMQHLLLGSLGRLGVLVELTFKVFPRGAARQTVAAEFATFDRALDALVRLRRSTFEPDAAELIPPAQQDGSDRASAGTRLFVRMAGIESALDARVSAVTSFLRADRATRLDSSEADAFWHAARECSWCDASNDATSLVKVPVTPGRVTPFMAKLANDRATWRYGAGGEVVWLAWVGPLDPLHRLLNDLGLQGLVITGGQRIASPLIGAPSDTTFLARVREALDPRGVFA